MRTDGERFFKMRHKKTESSLRETPMNDTPKMPERLDEVAAEAADDVAVLGFDRDMTASIVRKAMDDALDIEQASKVLTEVIR